MKILNSNVINAVMKPKQTLKDLVLGSARNNEVTVLAAIEADPAIEQVACSSALDIFLVSLDLKEVFKIKSNFLYVLQDTTGFNFLMIPESDKDHVSDLINFLTVFGVGSIVEIHNILGKKRYTVEDIKNNLDEVIRFSGYVKHYRYETNNYPLPIVNEYPFTSEVIYKGGYYVLELPSNDISLSDHLEYYSRIKGQSIEPIRLDTQGHYEYSEEDFKFITRLVLAYNFNCKRIAEAFSLPYEAFNGYLVATYRYKPNHVGVLHYNSSKHDIELPSIYNHGNFCYDPYNVINVA